MVEPRGQHTQGISLTQKDRYCDSTRVRSLEPSEPQTQKVDGGARVWGRGGESVCNGGRVSAWEDEKVLGVMVNGLSVAEPCT